MSEGIHIRGTPGILGVMIESVQFGRAEQSLLQRWFFVIALAAWCLYGWFVLGEHEWESLLVRGLPLAAVVWWSQRQMDKAARVEPGWVTLREGGKAERIPASNVTAIKEVETPGWLSRSVYVALE